MGGGKIIENGIIMKDTDGNVLHAHGGCMLLHEGTWYWYGENRTGRNYVSCYSSKDLVNWKFENNVLTMDSPKESTRVRADLRLSTDEGKRINIERPKVVFNRKTKKFVMWMHYENGVNYSEAAAAVAECDTPCGNFTYHGSFRPYGQMSRDCTLYQDGDTVYFISSSRENADMHVYRLQEDYLNTEAFCSNLWTCEYREAPALVKVKDMIYFFSSFCTSWDPNQCKYAKTPAKDFEKGFGLLKEIGDETTYRSQPAFIITLAGKSKTSYIYAGDRWNGNDYFDSRYVFFPLKFDEDGNAKLINCSKILIDAEEGTAEAAD